MQLLHRCALCACAVLLACDEEDDVPVVNIDAAIQPLPDGGGADAADAADAGCRDRFGEDDLDCDTLSAAQGDCDDHDPKRGPRALEIPMNGVDDDCRDGDALNAGPGCDGELDPKSTRRTDGVVAALGLCGERGIEMRGDTGLLRARWLRLNEEEELEDERQAWLPELFGRIEPREGKRMVVLSTGVARDLRAKDEYTAECDTFSAAPLAPDSWDGGITPPEGFPRDSKRCPKGITSEGAPAFNDVGLALRLRVPANATGIAFDSMFFTYEYPDFVCAKYNDFFVALLSPKPKGYKDGNILLDENGDPVGVNTGLLNVCTRADDRVARPLDCSRGTHGLLDTGYGEDESVCAPSSMTKPNIGGASTGWLHTEVPLRPFEVVNLVFRLWDSGDPLLDSTVLLDNFRFLTGPVGSEPSTVSCALTACP